MGRVFGIIARQWLHDQLVLAILLAIAVAAVVGATVGTITPRVLARASTPDPVESVATRS